MAEATDLLVAIKQQHTDSLTVDRAAEQLYLFFLIDMEGCTAINYEEEYNTHQLSSSYVVDLQQKYYLFPVFLISLS
jgi:hypothetical protein